MANQGVLEREAERRKVWADRGLADPLAVLSEERIAYWYYGVAVTSPRRAALEQFYSENPDIKPPRGW
jgi:hypothetical protein